MRTSHPESEAPGLGWSAGEFSGGFAGPFVEFSVDRARLGYDDPADPVLELEPIVVRTVLRTA